MELEAQWSYLTSVLLPLRDILGRVTGVKIPSTVGACAVIMCPKTIRLFGRVHFSPVAGKTDLLGSN